MLTLFLGGWGIVLTVLPTQSPLQTEACDAPDQSRAELP